MGVNGINNLSMYEYSRFMTWTAEQRAEFSKWFPQQADSKAVVKHFVKYEANKGFLDRIETWVNDRSPSWLTCYNLEGEGNIILNSTPTIVPVGYGITFSLNEPHEIKPSQIGTTWAFVVTFDNVWGN